jgi:hypothetical protein
MKLKILLFTVILIFVILQPVSAYLDPGFGSMVWQVIAGGVFIAAYAVKTYWQKLKGFFIKRKTNKPQEKQRT